MIFWMQIQLLKILIYLEALIELWENTRFRSAGLNMIYLKIDYQAAWLMHFHKRFPSIPENGYLYWMCKDIDPGDFMKLAFGMKWDKKKEA